MSNLLMVVLGVVGLFLLLRFFMWFKSWSKKGKPAPEVGGKLGQFVKRGSSVIAYFYSPSCSACKVQEKNLAQVQQKFSNIVRINVAHDHDVARKFGVMGTPTTVLIKDQKIQQYYVGVTPSTKILNAL